jgi:hypothetical protein
VHIQDFRLAAAKVSNLRFQGKVRKFSRHFKGHFSIGNVQVQVCEPHLDLLAFPSRLLEALGAGERPGNVSGVFMDVAGSCVPAPLGSISV